MPILATPAEGDARVAQLAALNRGFHPRVPHSQALGLEMLELGDGRAHMRLPWDPRLIGNPDTRVLHGGAITSLMDSCCGAAVFQALRQPVPIATLDLRIDYLKPAEPEQVVQARAHCFKVTRNVAFVRGFSFQGDEADPIAHATGTFMLGTKRNGAAKSSAATGAQAHAGRSSAQASHAAETHTDTAAPAGPSADFPQCIAHARDLGDPSVLLSSVPYARFLGVGVERVAGEVLTRMRFSPMLIGNPALPALHGGTVGALLETTSIVELLWRGEVRSLPRIVNISVDYLRSGRPEDAWGSATITKQGRRIVNVAATIWQSDRARPIAASQAHFLVDGGEGEDSA